MPDLTRASKFIALVLRHKPEVANLTLDSEGWTPVSDLLKGMAANGHSITRTELESLVANDAKGRYSFCAHGQKIRANQGHSLKTVELELEAIKPPDTLYHGTATRFLNSILEKGLLKMNRNHVHLSPDETTALAVGKRHGNPVIFTVNADKMYSDGMNFYQSDNGVWLTDHVPPEYLVAVNFP